VSPAPQGETDAIALPAHLASTCCLGQLQHIARGYGGGEHTEGLITFRPMGQVAARAPSVTSDRYQGKLILLLRTCIFSIANGRHQRPTIKIQDDPLWAGQ